MWPRICVKVEWMRSICRSPRWSRSIVRISAPSRIVVEAMARGVPVIASDVGGIPEAKLGIPYLLPVNTITRYKPAVDENMAPVAEVPEQDIAPWRATLARLLSDREHWEQVS